MLFASVLTGVLATSVAAVPLETRQNEAFVGAGQMTVIDPNGNDVGCLTNAGQFTTATSQCGAYNGTKTVSCAPPPYAFCSTTYGFTTPSGVLAAIFLEGSQYEEGGNRVLSSKPGNAGDQGATFTYGTGSDAQNYVEVLQDSDDSITFNTIGGKPASATPQDLQDDLGSGAEEGIAYSIKWTAT